MTKSPVAVLVVEQDPIRLEGLIALLNRGGVTSVIGAGRDLSSALASILDPGQRIDVVVLDIDQPSTENVSFWAVFRLAVGAKPRLVALSRGLNAHVLRAVIAAGACGVQAPDAAPERLSLAVRNAAYGLMDYDPLIVATLKDLLAFAQPSSNYIVSSITIDEPTGLPCVRGIPANLTERERRVLDLIGAAKTNRQIASDLRISERTASFHVSNILRKLELTSRVEAAMVSRSMHAGVAESTPVVQEPVRPTGP